MTTQTKPPKLPRKGRSPVHVINLKVPLQVYRSMIEGANLKWGEVTPFIVEAIREKLQRDFPNHEEK